MIKKLLCLLVLLLTATTGAMAQSAFTAKEITSASQLTSTDDEAYVAACMPSDFLAVDAVVAKAWTGAPTGSAILIYAIDGNKIKIATFLNGSNKATFGETWSIATFKDQLPNAKFFYTAAPTYSVTLAEGTEDAGKWTIDPTEAAEGSPVTVTYGGERKVKSVKAVKKAAPAPSVPDGAINGKFSVSDTKQVYFSKGNLRYASSKWSFFDNQYDYYTSYSADAWDKFGWSTSATTYGMNTSTDDNNYSGDFVDWGATMGTGWFTLSRFEWAYLFNTRSASTVNGTENGRYAKAKVNDVMGVILFPDTYTHPDGVTAPTGVNETGKTGWNGNSYSSADWTKMEAAGCVFLPAADSRNGSTVNGEGTNGYYWSATPNSTDAFCVRFYSSGLYPTEYFSRHNGYSVRLVQAVAAPAPAYTLLSAATTSDYGKVVCAAGHLHDAKTAVPDGCTAVGILGKVTETGHGLIIALQDATAQEWNTINDWTSVTSYAGTTLKVLPDDAARGTDLTSYTTLGETAVSNWAVAQKSDY